MNNTKQQTALLLINLGTPAEPTSKAVKEYLSVFLNDKRVMTLPRLLRKTLVDLLIVPSRAKKTTELYKQLWTPEGSPLLIQTENLKCKLQKKAGNDYTVFMAMRYLSPSIESALNTIREQGFGKLIVLPLYPHFASSTTETAVEEVKRVLKKWDLAPETHFIEPFYNHPGYLNALAQRILVYKPDEYDAILFSFHGLPLSHIRKAHADKEISDCNCKEVMPEHGRFCYLAACYHTVRHLAERLNLPPDSYRVSFQSRMSRKWLKPFTDATLIDLAGKGHKRVLVVAPSFVSDNLETLVEIGVEYKALFIANGGEKLTLVKSLNSDDLWVDGIAEIISGFIR